MTSKFDEIRHLIGKFYSGDLSPDDEYRLVQLLNETPGLPDDIADDRNIIVGIHDCRPAMPSSLPVKLDAIIAGLECRQRRFASRHAKVVAAAAAVVLLAGIGYIIKNAIHNPYEVTDPTTAFNETRRALLLVSDGLRSTDAFINEANTTFSGIDLSFYQLNEDDYTEDNDTTFQNIQNHDKI